MLQEERNAAMGDATVPATIYVEQPHAGLVSATDERASLPARAADSAACPVRYPPAMQSVSQSVSGDERDESSPDAVSRPKS